MHNLLIIITIIIIIYLFSDFTIASKVFIAEITGRAFIVADSNKRRTLSRADIAKALTKSDHFDFLIDIVPREEAVFSGGQLPQQQQQQPPSVTRMNGAEGGAGGVIVRKGGVSGLIQYLFWRSFKTVFVYRDQDLTMDNLDRRIWMDIIIILIININLVTRVMIIIIITRMEGRF